MTAAAAAATAAWLRRWSKRERRLRVQIHVIETNAAFPAVWVRVRSGESKIPFAKVGDVYSLGDER